MSRDEFIRRAAAIYRSQGALRPHDALSAAAALWEVHEPADNPEELAREDLKIWADSEGGEI